jgi:hypothetical protein
VRMWLSLGRERRLQETGPGKRRGADRPHKLGVATAPHDELCEVDVRHLVHRVRVERGAIAE